MNRVIGLGQIASSLVGMRPSRVVIAVLALCGAFYAFHMLTTTPSEQVDAAVNPQVQEPVRVFSEQFYACPPKDQRQARKERATTLQSLVTTPLSDPAFFCDEVLAGDSSTAAVTNLRTVFVNDSSAGVVSDITLSSEGKSESISINVELTLTDDGWKIAAVS